MCVCVCAPPCPLPASPPCFLAGHTTCDAPSSDHVLSQAQALCTRLGRKGKLTRKWLATPHFANMLMCVSVGASVSLLARRVRPPLLQCLMMLPHPSISHRPPALGGGVNNNLSMGPRWMSDGLLPHCRSRLAAHLAVGSMVLVAGCGAGREVGPSLLSTRAALSGEPQRQRRNGAPACSPEQRRRCPQLSTNRTPSSVENGQQALH